MAKKIADRCQTTLGFLPCIERPEPKPDEQIAPLNYDCDKIQKTGFILKGDVDDEIDRTLMVCKQAW
jgi:UDP-glucose 4-epimerase